MGEQETALGGVVAGLPAGARGTAAVVVTYEPGAELAKNLKALRPQVDRLIVVDNGSSPEVREAIRAAAEGASCELIENGENLGIAAALNRGVENALQQGSEWIFLFDQDSRATPDFVEAMLRAYATSRWGERLKILTPQYREIESGAVIPPVRAKEGIAVALTSGSLFRAETLRTYGLFRTELFIDEVDHEYSLRLRRAGMVLDETPNATLLHVLGSPSTRSAGGRELRAMNYSPVRRYYQERNKVWMARHYGLSFPRFVLSRFRMSFADMWKIAAFEDRKWRKIRYALRGFVDGLRGRMGRLDEPSADD